jgi:hypothetical protein
MCLLLHAMMPEEVAQLLTAIALLVPAPLGPQVKVAAHPLVLFRSETAGRKYWADLAGEKVNPNPFASENRECRHSFF